MKNNFSFAAMLVELASGCEPQETHLIADTEGHLWNLYVDEGVVHSGSLLHLIDVIDRVLAEGNHQRRFIPLLCFILDFRV